MLKVRSPILDMLCMILAQAQTASPPTVLGGGIGSLLVPLILIFIIIYFVISGRISPRQKLGRLLVAVGVAIGGYFLVLFDTSVEVGSHYVPGYGDIGGDRVNNLGRMQNRSLGCFAGIAMAVVGTIMIISDKKA